MVPFPSDQFTEPDERMITGRRVALPLPADSGAVSEREDTEAVNLLDGFSLFPRITVPLSGELPDGETFTSENVFLVNLVAPSRGRVIPIDQRLVDDSVLGAPRLIFAPDVYLEGVRRYALVVTRGLTGANGEPYGPGPQLQQLLTRYRLGLPPRSEYEAALFDAMRVLEAAQLATPQELATLSVFTTRTVADVPLKLLRRLDSGDITVAPPRFDIDGRPGVEIIAREQILRIDSYLHRASQISDGSSRVSFTGNALRIKDNALVLSDDLSDEVYILNARTGQRLLVPEETIDAFDGSIISLDVANLVPQPGDELAVLVRKPRVGADAQEPHLWRSVAFVVFGSVEVPIYLDADGVIPRVPSGVEFEPTQTGSHDLRFSLFLPNGPPPVGGWPVVHFLHGGAEDEGGFLAGGVLPMASILAAQGMATIAFTAAEFGGGERSFVEVHTPTGTRTIQRTGRGQDLNLDGYFERTALYPYPQRISDLGTLVRSIQWGVDFNGDHVSDLAVSPARTFVTGVSYGGAATLIAAGLEDRASVFVPNVPAAIGSRGRSSGFQAIPSDRARSYAEDILAARKPSLLNGPSPVWGGSFNENVPMKRQPVQLGGMVPGVEAIQRAIDFLMWRDLEHMPAGYVHSIRSGALRGGPAAVLLQVVRGDGAALNHSQAQMILSGELAAETAIVRLDREPAFDAWFGEVLPAELARHIPVALPYSGRSGTDVAGRICHLTRYQISEFVRRRGGSVPDPDGSGVIFSGDIFEYPISAGLLEEMLVDPGLPE
jgi:hypothetical protein